MPQQSQALTLRCLVATLAPRNTTTGLPRRVILWSCVVPSYSVVQFAEEPPRSRLQVHLPLPPAVDG